MLSISLFDRCGDKPIRCNTTQEHPGIRLHMTHQLFRGASQRGRGWQSYTSQYGFRNCYGYYQNKQKVKSLERRKSGLSVNGKKLMIDSLNLFNFLIINSEREVKTQISRGIS